MFLLYMLFYKINYVTHIFLFCILSLNTCHHNCIDEYRELYINFYIPCIVNIRRDILSWIYVVSIYRGICREGEIFWNQLFHWKQVFCKFWDQFLKVGWWKIFIIFCFRSWKHIVIIYRENMSWCTIVNINIFPSWVYVVKCIVIAYREIYIAGAIVICIVIYILHLSWVYVVIYAVVYVVIFIKYRVTLIVILCRDFRRGMYRGGNSTPGVRTP